MKKTAKTRQTPRVLPADKPGPVASLLADGAPRLPAGFAIVGIGASAGGLEALEIFLQNVPKGSGCAFVIVQHLDPTHQGILPELLQRRTEMEVFQVKDRLRVRPDCVYVIPPNKDLSLLHGVLHLLVPTAPRGLRLPIDFFFRSLALDQRACSVGVILSGMGSDGTLGLKAIKEQAGVVLVQEPASAKFDGMPRSALDTGLVDIVAPVEELPERIAKYLRRTPLLAPPKSLEESGAEGYLEKVVILLRSQTRHDFSLYKRSTLYRRIERRMGLHQITKVATYVRYLRENPVEVDLLFKELLIGVTSFFRDPAAWEQLRDEALPPLFKDRAARHVLRAWVPGCSSGEEAYTLAIIFQEALDRVPQKGLFSLQIYATDLDGDAVDRARQGAFPASIATEVSSDRLARFFRKEERGYRVAKEIREMIIFAPQNLIMDPPFTKLDILSCRNLLIYFAPELQRKIFPLFHYSLNPGGVLFLGSAESIGSFTGLFRPVRGKSRIFHRLESAERTGLVEFPSALLASPLDPPKTARVRAVPPGGIQAQAEQWLLQHHAPAAALVNDQGDILFISGRTGRFLEPAAGKANWNLFVMAREGLRYELSGTFQKARRGKEPVTSRRLSLGTNGATIFVNLTVQFLAEPEVLRGLAMVVFAEVAGPAKEIKGRVSSPARQNQRAHELEQEMQRARDEVQSSREEMQTSQEELKSMNEEMQSTNEELQSTNEELTTSKEEMQSLNEELQAVNAELQTKVDELTATSSDMKNLLNSTEIATVFLDNALRVRRFTEQSTKIFKFIPGDVGRPVTDLATDLLYPEMADDAREVLRKLISIEKPVATGDGRWFALRLMPYRTLDDRIDGVVITFTDLSLARKMEADLRAKEKKIKPTGSIS